MDFALRTGKMSFLEFSQKNTLFGKTNYSMFYYSLKVIDEPKMSEIQVLNLCHKKSILVDIYRKSLLKKRLKKRPILDQNHGLTPWEKSQLSEFLNLLFLYLRKAFFRFKISYKTFSWPIMPKKKSLKNDQLWTKTMD